MPINKPSAVAEAPQKTLVTPAQPVDPTPRYASAEDAKSTRILRQGIYQAVVQSPGLAGLQYTNAQEYVKLVETVAEQLIVLVTK